MRYFFRDGDATELTLFAAGMLALLGLIARMIGVWP